MFTCHASLSITKWLAQSGCPQKSKECDKTWKMNNFETINIFLVDCMVVAESWKESLNDLCYAATFFHTNLHYFCKKKFKPL